MVGVMRFRWIKDLGEMIGKEARMEITLPTSADRSFRGLAAELQSYMQANAPWNDRTGNARANLQAKYTGGGTLYRVELSHGVPYGKYLEFGTKNMAARPIIRPTLDHATSIAAAKMGDVIRETFGA